MTTQNNDQNQRLYDEGDLRRYFAMMPNMADEELGLHEYRLYGHYRHICQVSGKCDETERTTCEKTNMGREKFRETRAALAAKGYIRIVAEGTPDAAGHKGTPTVIALINVWAKNFVKCASPEEIAEFSSLIPSELRQPQKTPAPPTKVTGTAQNRTPKDPIPTKVAGIEEDPTGTEQNPTGTEEDPTGTEPGWNKNKKSEESENPLKATGADAAGEGLFTEQEGDSLGPPAELLQADYQQHCKPMLAKDKAKEQKEAETINPLSKLLAHPFVAFFMEKTRQFKLTNAQAKLMTGDIYIPQEEGTLEIKGGLLRQWEEQPGFDEFVKQRIPQLLAMRNTPSWENMLRNLRNLHNPGPQMPGFWEWRKANPRLCQIVQPAKPERKVTEEGTGEDKNAPLF